MTNDWTTTEQMIADFRRAVGLHCIGMFCEEYKQFQILEMECQTSIELIARIATLLHEHREQPHSDHDRYTARQGPNF